MKKLLSYLKEYILQCVSAPLFKLFEAVLDLSVPIIIAYIIDTGITNEDNGIIIKYSVLLIIIAAVSLGFALTAQYFAAKAAVGFSYSLRKALYARICGMSYTELDTMGSSSIITRITADADSVGSGVNLTLRLFLRSPLIVFGAVTAAFIIDVTAGIIFTSAVVAVSLLLFIILKSTVPIYGKTRKKLDTLTCRTREGLSGARVIRAYCREDETNSEFEKADNEYVKLQRFSGKISAILNPVSYVIINLALILLLNSGAIKVNAGALSRGSVIALYNYLSQILVELIKLANLIVTISRALASAKRISDVLSNEDNKNTDNKTDIISGDVRFDDVSFIYSGAGAPSLYNISFRVKAGEHIGIIGGTGSGKTTLVNLIAGFYSPSSGSIDIGGSNINSISSVSLRNNISIAPQHAQLFSGTIRDNISLGRNISDEQIIKAAAFAQAKDIIEKKGGLDFSLSEGGSDLSGGQRQRLTVARAVAGEPKILILDDSASALDFATEKLLRRAVSGLKETTVFTVSQRISSVMHSDRIIVLDSGRLIGIGTHDELLYNCPVYTEIFNSQTNTEAV